MFEVNLLIYNGAVSRNGGSCLYCLITAVQVPDACECRPATQLNSPGLYRLITTPLIDLSCR